jgi:conjugative transfer region protein TrbK
MNVKVLIRGAAYLVFAVALLAGAIDLNKRRYLPTDAIQPSISTDSLDAELAHCRALGVRAARDPACKTVWQANRERFFNSKKFSQDRITDPVPMASNPNRSAPGSGGQSPRRAPAPANRAGQPQ